MPKPSPAFPDAMIEALRAVADEKGNVPLPLMEKVFRRIQWPTTTPDTLRQELEEIAGKLEEASQETRELMQAQSHQSDISNATLELDAAIKATEDAANCILDAAELVQARVLDSPLASDEEVNEALMEIITACNFQDLSGQRIRKVVTVLQFIAPKIQNLIAVLLEEGEKTAAASQVIGRELDDRSLMNGPQLPDKAPTQADIDALFDKN